MPTSTVASAVRRIPGIPPSKVPPHSDLRPARKPRPRRQIRGPAFPGVNAGARPRKDSAASGGRRSGPSTPLLRWKFSEKPSQKTEAVTAGEPPSPPPQLTRVSARKLVAGIWRLRPIDSACGGGGEGWRARVGLESGSGCQQVQLLYNPLSTGIHTNKSKKLEFASPVSVLSPKHSEIHKCSGFPSSALEKATKWDPGSSMTSEEVYRFYSHLKLLEDQEVNTVSVISSLRTELEKAHVRVSELETERKSSKKKLDQFLKRLAEEKASWRSREHEKVRTIIEAMKADLDRERKKQQKIDIVNSKLVNELAEVRLTAKKLLQDYEKERKARELVEEVCDELTKEIGEDKAEIEALKIEAMKIREEAEVEKRMLQMAEVWREERVQMKLIDAKLTLQEKYSQMMELKADLDAFLAAKKSGAMDVALTREAELLKDKVNLVNVEDIKEFIYQPPPASEDIYAVFQELQPRQETSEANIHQQCSGLSPRSHASKINESSHESNVFLEHHIKPHEDELFDSDEDAEDESDWETMSHPEEQGSSNTLDGSEPSVNDYFKESNADASVSEAEWKEIGDNKPDAETVREVCSTNAKSRKKVPSISKLWRSSMHDITGIEPGRLSVSDARVSNNGEEHKKHLVEHANGRLTKGGRISNGTLSPDIGLGESGLSPGSLGQWNSPDSLNPHITQGMKGCIEWPRGNQKRSLKAKLIDARMESRKIQLRHVLKQKI
ncbi:uncharacterized protein LOC121991959 [Zingiber officinale]|uniref:Uncharacterized protein n=1 Tax=Zingiber officinale TaxID=94328 RepID=A0A8J5M699_ZINOF|nr:uncharacterized protein LOC121991959 [Zingiber officinale]KAG6534986.1 hypothetical protein ZIOFF_008900 [Zingiber officinale]